jgi:hypothetical protein
LTFTTTYDPNAGFDVPPPRDLLVEARGSAESLHDAGELFGNAPLSISAIVSVAANATMGVPALELIFDINPESEEHEFLQSYNPDEPVIAVPGRRIDLEIVRALVQALAHHPERERIQRAIAQYTEALQSWRPGREITCLAHLYMGIEAITKAVLRNHLAGRSEQELVLEWGIEPKFIESETRRRLVFRGDDVTYKKARGVSDGFEHGFSDLDEMRKPAIEVILKTGAYLRQTIIEILNIDATLQARALGPDYAKPRGPLVAVRYLYGTLLGKAEQLAMPNQSYPHMVWKSTIKNVAIGADGRFNFTLDETATANIGEGVKLRPSRFEVWDGSTMREENPPPTK